MNKNYKKIGILGGTFDPPHIGHLHISKIAIKKLKLNSLIWIIAKNNSFKKKPELSSKIRINLSKKITKNYKNISVKYFDKKKYEKTYDLLKIIKKKNKENKIFFLIGADNLIKFHKWKKWKKIPELAKIVVFAREDFLKKALNSVAAKKLKKSDWFYINSKKMNISSSLIRKF